MSLCYICTERPTAPQFSLGFTGIRTSPPSIPQSAQFGTQDRLSTQRSSQSQRHLSQTPAPPSRSLLDTSTTRTPRNKPSTSHQASPARTSQGRRSAPRRTQDPITPSQAGLRSSQGNAGASRECITTQSTPSLTNNSPKSRHADTAAQGSGETPGSYSRQRTILGLAPHRRLAAPTRSANPLAEAKVTESWPQIPENHVAGIRKRLNPTQFPRS